nr:hypothetical protein [Mycobacteroides abscessus]
MQSFTNGTIFSSPPTGAHLVQGECLTVYTHPRQSRWNTRLPHCR